MFLQASVCSHFGGGGGVPPSGWSLILPNWGGGGVTPSLVRTGVPSYPGQVTGQDEGMPHPRSRGYPRVPPQVRMGGGVPQSEQHGAGRYSSCVHAGGLSCFIFWSVISTKFINQTLRTLLLTRTNASPKTPPPIFFPITVATGKEVYT